MTTRVPARLLVILLQLCAWHAAHAQSLDRTPVRVQLIADAKDDMGGVTWNAMTEECRRIWSREGVEITWGAAAPNSAPFHVSLPIIFDDRELRKYDPKGVDAFGV